MISNATRTLCALLSAMGAAGLVLFVDPANAARSPSGLHAPVVADAPLRG